MIVADTNIISYLLMQTPYTDDADKLYQADPIWAAPMLWKSEFRNVLALYLRKGMITFDKALQLQEMAESIMSAHEYDTASTQILSLVNGSTCSSYDCEFVALANYLGVKLITQDKKLLREFPSVAIGLRDYLPLH